MKKKKTTTIIVTRDKGYMADLWKSKAKPIINNYGVFPYEQSGHIATLSSCLSKVFKLFPSRPRKGQKKKYRVTVEEI